MGYTLKHFQGHPYPSPYCGRQTPYGRDTKGAKCPAVGTSEEGKSPAPGLFQINTAAVFIHYTIE